MTVLTTSDGVEIAVRSWPALGEPRGTVVLVHGLAATKDHPEVGAVATALAERSLDVVAYDARGHGASGGICTLGDLERHDVAAAVEYARLRGLPVVLVGASMGGVAVLRHAVTDDGLAGVVTVSSPAEWRLTRAPGALLLTGLIRTAAGRLLAARLFHVRLAPEWSAPEPPAALASRIQVPMAVVHGERDRFVPPAAAALLYAAGGGPRRLVLVPRMGHAFHRRALPAIGDAVDWALAQSSSPVAV
jgi:alpha-beta hydrolase superfamily lysophospholipase